MSVMGTVLEYKRFAVHDGDGIRTTLFLKGCPLSCKWCHNPEGIAFRPQLAYLPHKCINCGECAICPSGAHTFTDAHRFDRNKCTVCKKCTEVCLGEALMLHGRQVSAAEAAEELFADRDFFAASGGGITLSGGEPLMQPDFTAEVFRLAHINGISTALDTCGYAPREALEKVLPYTDKVLFDIKAASSITHKRYTGKPNELILDNIGYIASAGIPTEIRIPLIPGVNLDEIDRIGEILEPFKNITAVRLLPYHGCFDTKYESLGMKYEGGEFEAPSSEMLADAAAVLKKYVPTVILP